jgi:hypothetical protein
LINVEAKLDLLAIFIQIFPETGDICPAKFAEVPSNLLLMPLETGLNGC